MTVATPKRVEEGVFGSPPESWSLDRVRDRLGVIVGGEWGDDLDAHDEGVEIPVIRVADFRGLDISTEDLTIRRVKESKLLGRLIGTRTLLLEKSGGGELKPVGRAVLGRKITVDAICSNFIAKTECGASVDPLFVAYVLNAAYAAGVNTAHIQQTTGIQNLRVTDYLNSKVAFPSLSEQSRIAAYLEASCNSIDLAMAAKGNQLGVLDAMRASILLTALTTGVHGVQATQQTLSPVLPRIPVGWRLLRLKSVADVRYGLGQPPAQLDAGVGMIRATDVDAGHISTANLMRVDPEELPVDRNPYLKVGEIIVVRSGAYTGDSAIVPPECEGCVAGYDMVVTVARASPHFVAYCLLSRYVLEGQILLLTQRAAQPHLNAEELGGVLLALPPTRAEQDAIVAFLDKRLAEVREVERGIKSQIETLTAYRRSLIHECVTGTKRISEAELKRVQSHG